MGGLEEIKEQPMSKLRKSLRIRYIRKYENQGKGGVFVSFLWVGEECVTAQNRASTVQKRSKTNKKLDLIAESQWCNGQKSSQRWKKKPL